MTVLIGFASLPFQRDSVPPSGCGNLGGSTIASTVFCTPSPRESVPPDRDSVPPSIGNLYSSDRDSVLPSRSFKPVVHIDFATIPHRHVFPSSVLNRKYAKYKGATNCGNLGVFAAALKRIQSNSACSTARLRCRLAPKRLIVRQQSRLGRLGLALSEGDPLPQGKHRKSEPRRPPGAAALTQRVAFEELALIEPPMTRTPRLSLRKRS